MNVSFFFRSLLSSLLVLCCIYPAAAEQKTRDALSQLENAMRKEITQNPRNTDETNRRNQRGDERAMVLYQLRSVIERGEKSQVDETLRQVLLAFSSEDVQSAIEKLRAAVQIERGEKEKALFEAMQALLEKTGKAVRSAQKPADLDGVIRDLSVAQEQREEVSTAQTRAIANNIQNARQFTVTWQDYLDHKLGGRMKLAQESLQKAANHNGAEVLPRSEILERLAEFKKAEEAPAQPTSVYVRLREIMEKTKTLDDLPPAIDAVRLLRGFAKTSDRWDDPAVHLHEELLRIQQGYKDFRAGLPTIVQVRSDQRPAMVEAIELAVPLKTELLRLVVPRFLRVSEKPAMNEPLDTYIDRMMRVAFDRCDPRLILRIYHVRNAINGISNAVRLSAGLDALLAARNQDDAGQYVPAVISYQKALRLGGELVPVESVGRRLAAIKAANPSDYEAGMKRFLEAPDPGPPYPEGADGAFSLRVPATEPSPP